MRELREVSRSGSTGSARHLTAACPRGSDELDSKVLHVTRASDGVYDAPPILADLRAAGERVSRKTVAGWLRRQHPAEISPRTFAPPPRWPTPTRRCRRTWSDADPTPESWIGCGRLISPIRAPGSAGSIYARSGMAARGGRSAGPSMSTRAPIYSSPRWPWRSPRAASRPRRLWCTLTAAVSTPARRRRGSPAGTI